MISEKLAPFWEFPFSYFPNEWEVSVFVRSEYADSGFPFS